MCRNLIALRYIHKDIDVTTMNYLQRWDFYAINISNKNSIEGNKGMKTKKQN